MKPLLHERCREYGVSITSARHCIPPRRAIGCAVVWMRHAQAGVGHFVFSSVLHAIFKPTLSSTRSSGTWRSICFPPGLSSRFCSLQITCCPFRLIPVFEEGVFRLSWSLDRWQSMVDLDDIAHVAALVLGESERHAGATYELVGPGRFTAHDIGRVLSTVLPAVH